MMNSDDQALPRLAGMAAALDQIKLEFITTEDIVNDA